MSRSKDELGKLTNSLQTLQHFSTLEIFLTSSSRPKHSQFISNSQSSVIIRIALVIVFLLGNVANLHIFVKIFPISILEHLLLITKPDQLLTLTFLLALFSILESLNVAPATLGKSSWTDKLFASRIVLDISRSCGRFRGRTLSTIASEVEELNHI